MVALVESRVFEVTIMTLILFNSITLALYDYHDRDDCTQWNKNLQLSGTIFSICFICESVLKIIAYGFIIHENSYLHDTWNWIDFTVVLVSVLELIQVPALKLKALRTARVLRPLRSIKALPGMRKLITSLLRALHPLSYAVMFMFLIFMLFGILGIQQFNGIQYQRCRLTPTPLSPTSWPYDKSIDRLCTQDGTGIYECVGEGVTSWCR